MTSTGPGLRERKKEQTKQNLKRVALELFAAEGFDAVSTDDIAAAADVSKTTFYRYFDSKEDVLLGTSSDNRALMRAALAERPVDEPAVEAARHAFRLVAELYENDREQKLLVSKVAKSTPSLAARNLEHQAAWEQMLRDDFARRDPAAEGTLRTWVLAAAVMASLRTAIDFWLTHGAESDLATLVDDSLRLLADGSASRPH